MKGSMENKNLIIYCKNYDTKAIFIVVKMSISFFFSERFWGKFFSRGHFLYGRGSNNLPPK